MSAKSRLAKSELRRKRRERMADPEVSLAHMLREGDSPARIVVKAITRRRTRSQ